MFFSNVYKTFWKWLKMNEFDFPYNFHEDREVTFNQIHDLMKVLDEYLCLEISRSVESSRRTLRFL